MMTSSLCFSESVYKPKESKLGNLIVNSKFHKICKFENHVTRNDIITKNNGNSDLRKTKQIIYHSKGIDENYPKMHFFIEFEPLCQKLWAFMPNFGIFYDACSPNYGHFT